MTPLPTEYIDFQNMEPELQNEFEKILNNPNPSDSNMSSYFKDLLVIQALLLSYAMYVQFNPKIGNIWWRRNDTGEKSLQLQNLWNLMKQPLKLKDPVGRAFWQLKNLDMNCIATTTGGFALYKAISCFLSKK
tara:strand:+ start:1175 stop:1573 length:399 start_codon:yes stop_codon:yes gene_type:complete